MKNLIILMIFIGSLMILMGIYEEKLKIAESSKKIEYKFIPRTYYDEQLSGDNSVSLNFSDMFKKQGPWLDKEIGPNFSSQH